MSLIPISSLKHLQRMCLSGKGITKTPTEKVFLHVKLPETPSMYVFQERSNKLLIRGYLKNLVKALDELCGTSRTGQGTEGKKFFSKSTSI